MTRRDSAPPIENFALRADRIETMSGPSIVDGAIIVRGSRIVDVGPARKMLRAHRCVAVHDYGQATILPGLINAHTHLELSALIVPSPGQTHPALTDWLGAVVQQTAASAPEQWVPAGTAIGIEASLRFGVTTVGDITRFPRLSRTAYRANKLRGVSFGEVLAMGTRRSLLEERIAAAVSDIDRPMSVAVGISPHAPYSIEMGGIQRCLEVSRQQQLPLMMHLAESRDEAEFLESHTGPLRTLWNRIGGWDEHIPRFAGGPIRLAKTVGLLDYAPALLAHVNYCDDGELAILAAGKASVVYCPRTHRYFGHPPHRWREMLSRGINVAIGTDSPASSPDLNPVNDLRLMLEDNADLPMQLLFELLTTRAAKALGSELHSGQIAPGLDASFAIFPAHGADPLRFLLESGQLPTAVWSAGHLVHGASAD